MKQSKVSGKDSSPPNNSFSPSGQLAISDSIERKFYPNPFTTNKNSGKKINESHRKISGPLFPHRPQFADLIQGAIGDCYLIASLIAIINLPNGQGPDILMNMMREDKDGNIIVKMHKDEKFQELKVEKSVRWRLIGPAQRAKGPLWVNIIEKAYTAFELGGDYFKLGDGGPACKVLEAILGTPAKEIDVHPPQVEHPFEKLLTWHNKNQEAKNLSQSILQYPDNKLIATQISKVNSQIKEIEDLKVLDEKELKIWEKICQELEIPWKILYKETSDKNGVIRFNDFKKLLTSINCEHDAEKIQVLNNVIAWAEKNNLFPGKRGSGKYTEDQKKIFHTIKQGLETNTAMTAATHQKISSSIGNGKGYAGEDVHKGLISRHAYAIIGCEQRGDLLGIVLRNPWGEVGRDYRNKSEGVLTPITTKSGEFWMELSDFTKRFQTISMAQAPSLPLIADKSPKIGANPFRFLSAPTPVASPAAAPVHIEAPQFS